MFNSKHDAEISRLRDEMNRLFEAKQSAWDEKERLKKIKDSAKSRMDEAWQRRRSAADIQNRLYEQNQAEWSSIANLRNAMNAAFDRAKASRDSSQQMWDDVHRTIDENNRRIDDLKARADYLARDMHEAFDNASRAWDDHDRASAKEYSEEGHRIKDELQELNTEVSRLINENKSILANAKYNNSGGYLWDEFHRLRGQYIQAKSEHSERDRRFHQAKAAFEQAKAEHEQALADYQKAKADFEQARDKFNNLNQQFKEAKAKYNEAKKHRKSSADDIARQAGIPSQYLGNVIVKEDSPGCYSIYFGGAGSPDGPGHGHYVLDNGTVTYHRDPYQPHGHQNYDDYKDSLEFQNYQSAAERSEIGRLAVSEAEAELNRGPRHVEYKDEHVKIATKSGFNYDRRKNVTDTLIFDRTDKSHHYHVVIDDDGDTIINEKRKNH